MKSQNIRYSKVSIAAGIIAALILAGFVLWKRESFLEIQPRGEVLFWVSLLLSCALGAAIAVCPAREWKWYPLWQALVFLMAPAAAISAVERLNGNFLSELHENAGMLDENYCIALMLFLALFVLTGSVRIPIWILNPAFLVFGLANMYLKEFRGGPLVPMDVGCIATAATVAGGYTYTVGAALCYAVIVTLWMLALSHGLGMRRSTGTKHTRNLRLAALLVVCLAIVIGYGTDLPVKVGYKPDFFNQLRGYENKGAVLEFALNTRYLRLSRPADYDADQVGEEVRKALSPGKKAGTGKKPNIIVIMNESFADLQVLGDFQSDRDYMPFLHRLKENAFQGEACVSVLGTGTSNTEFEFLTGNSMAFLPAGSNAYQLYVRGEQPGLVSTLKAQGYQTAALHPYYRGNWNRVKVYDWMGFDRYTGLEDMFPEEIVEPYRQKGNIVVFRKELEKKYRRKDIILRDYVSDSYNYEELIRQYEARDRDKPFFMFNVTMQNHSPYNMSMYGLEERVRLQNVTQRYPLADQYLSVIRYSDEALEKLVTYFRKEKEPTIILFFGDHQPYVEDEFCSEIMGTDVTKAEGAELQKRYISHMMLWANYDLPEDVKDLPQKVSVNYLSSLLLRVAELDMPDYNRYLLNLSEKIPVLTTMGATDARGQYFRVDEENPYEDDLSVYQNAVYNNLIDADGRQDDLFYLKDKKNQ